MVFGYRDDRGETGRGPISLSHKQATKSQYQNPLVTIRL